MVDTVLAALDRGHGTMCDLSNRPAPRGGYFPCVDVGPYRFVKGYGTLSAFVVVADAAPFPVFRAGENGEEFLVRGQWMRDLAPRVAAWWSDEVGGGRERREAGEATSTRLRDAEREVMRDYPQPPAAPVPPVAPVTEQVRPAPAPRAAQPQATAPVPAEEAPQPTGSPGSEALRQSPIPSRPSAGRELAPGVVQLPSGGPYAR
jgi:hypothetical protein